MIMPLFKEDLVPANLVARVDSAFRRMTPGNAVIRKVELRRIVKNFVVKQLINEQNSAGFHHPANSSDTILANGASPILSVCRVRKTKFRIPQFDILTIGAQVFGLLITLLIFYYYSIISTIPFFISIKKFRTKKLIKNKRFVTKIDTDLNCNIWQINYCYKVLKFLIFIVILLKISTCESCQCMNSPNYIHSQMFQLASACGSLEYATTHLWYIDNETLPTIENQLTGFLNFHSTEGLSEMERIESNNHVNDIRRHLDTLLNHADLSCTRCNDPIELRSSLNRVLNLTNLISSI